MLNKNELDSGDLSVKIVARDGSERKIEWKALIYEQPFKHFFIDIEYFEDIVGGRA